MLRRRKTLRLWFALAIGLVTLPFLCLTALKASCSLEPLHEERTVSTDEKSTKHQTATNNAEYPFPLKQNEAKGTKSNSYPQYLKNFNFPGFCEEAKYTDIALVYFTGCLVVVGWFGIRSSERAVRDMERAILFGGPFRPMWTGAHTAVHIAIENYGRSMGVLKEVYVEISVTEPSGKYPSFDKTKGISRSFDEGFPPAPLRKPNEQPTIVGTWESPHQAEHYVFGYLRYEDIFRTTHHNLFCTKINPATHRVECVGPQEWGDWD